MTRERLKRCSLSYLITQYSLLLISESYRSKNNEIISRTQAIIDRIYSTREITASFNKKKLIRELNRKPDFGVGFYMTDDIDLASKTACKNKNKPSYL